MPHLDFVRFDDLTAIERVAVNTAVVAADAASAIVRLNHKSRVAVIVATVRSMDDLSPASRSKVVRYFTVN
jgi:hypothetical protein